MGKLKVLHYINQFYAGIGGEEMADVAPELREGAMGPGLAFNSGYGDEAEITHTIVCGDSFFNERLDEAKELILDMVKSVKPDLFVAGPAFNAGRYGVACATIAYEVLSQLGIPVLTGMYEENPGVDMFRDKLYIVATRNSAAGMRDAVSKMVPLSLKLARGETIGASAEEGYHPTGVRVNFFEKERGSSVRLNAAQEDSPEALYHQFPCPTLTGSQSRCQRHRKIQWLWFLGRHCPRAAIVSNLPAPLSMANTTLGVMDLTAETYETPMAF